MIATARPYLTALVTTLPRQVVLALVLMGGLTLTEGVGLLLLVPLLQLAGLDIQTGGAGRVVELIAWLFGAANLHPSLLVVLGVYLAVIAARALLLRRQMIAITELHTRFAAHLRVRLYRAISGADWPFLARCRASDLTHALTAEIDRVAAATHALLSLLIELVVGAVYLLFALQLSATMTVLVLLAGAVLWLLLRERARAASAAGEELSVATSRLYGASIEHLAAIKTAKSYGAQERNIGLFERLANQVAGVYLDLTRTGADVKVWSDIGAGVLLCLALVVLIEVVAMPTAEILLLLFVFSRLMPRFARVRFDYQTIANSLPAFARISRLLAACEAAAEASPVGHLEVKLGQDIRFEGVTFAYAPDLPPTLRQIDLFIPVGSTTAIVGPSGAGKSTTADLVMGLIVPSYGQVLVDGVPLEGERVLSWREQIGYVAQDTFLFHDSVRANLLWACPETGEDDLWEALRLAAAEGFVRQLPQGLETVVGDRGVRLSGGERQRLALARALLRKPSLLILDEATNNLDPENEEQIQRAIEALHGRTTILLITHRLATVLSADRVYVLDGGRVVESGAPDSLLSAPGGRFRALWSAQGPGASVLLDTMSAHPRPGLERSLTAPRGKRVRPPGSHR